MVVHEAVVVGAGAAHAASPFAGTPDTTAKREARTVIVKVFIFASKVVVLGEILEVVWS